MFGSPDSINRQMIRAIIRGSLLYLGFLGGMQVLAGWSDWLEAWRVRIAAEPMAVGVCYIGWICAYIVYECLLWKLRQDAQSRISLPPRAEPRRRRKR